MDFADFIFGENDEEGEGRSLGGLGCFGFGDLVLWGFGDEGLWGFRALGVSGFGVQGLGCLAFRV